jgi:hypothetical protein
MRNFIEKLKDILYDGIDYILIIGIIAVIAFTINWKLNGIFAVADVDELYSQSSDTNKSTEDKDKIEEISSDEDEVDTAEKEEDEENPTSNEDKTEETSNEIKNNNENNVDKQEDKKDNSKEDTQTAEKYNNDNSNENNEVITVSIPAGSLPGDIGNILTSKGLVESKEAFLRRVAETGTEKKLRYGEFEISKNSTIDEIISILAR